MEGTARACSKAWSVRTAATRFGEHNIKSIPAFSYLKRDVRGLPQSREEIPDSLAIVTVYLVLSNSQIGSGGRGSVVPAPCKNFLSCGVPTYTHYEIIH